MVAIGDMAGQIPFVEEIKANADIVHETIFPMGRTIRQSNNTHSLATDMRKGSASD